MCAAIHPVLLTACTVVSSTYIGAAILNDFLQHYCHDLQDVVPLQLLQGVQVLGRTDDCKRQVLEMCVFPAQQAIGIGQEGPSLYIQ